MKNDSHRYQLRLFANESRDYRHKAAGHKQKSVCFIDALMKAAVIDSASWNEPPDTATCNSIYDTKKYASLLNILYMFKNTSEKSLYNAQRKTTEWIILSK
jgi:hypothetical protein